MKYLACVLALVAFVSACGSKKGDGGGAANQPVTIEATATPGPTGLVVSIKAHVMADVTLVEPKLAPKDAVIHRDGGGAFSMTIPTSALPAGAETTLRLRAQRPGKAEFAETTVTYTRGSECPFDMVADSADKVLVLKCEGIAGAGWITRPKAGKLAIELTFPPGSSFLYDGKTTTPADGKFTASIDAWPIIRALTPTQVALKESTNGVTTRFPFPVTVTSGGQTYELPFAVPYSEFVHSAYEIYERAAKGKPGLFPGEAAVAKGKPASSLFQSMAIVGDATRADEVDLVATTDSRVRTLSCGSFASADGTTRGSVKAEMADLVATVRDRRTGKKLGEKTFRAPDATCPDSIQGAGGAMVTGTAADEGEAQTWIDSFWKH